MSPDWTRADGVRPNPVEAAPGEHSAAEAAVQGSLADTEEVVDQLVHPVDLLASAERGRQKSQRSYSPPEHCSASEEGKASALGVLRSPTASEA
jgi:hypothetical protein